MSNRVTDFVNRVNGRYRRWLDPSQDDLRKSGVISMGNGSYGQPFVVYHEGDHATVTIGKYCSLAAGVRFMPGGNHRTDWVSTYPFRLRYGLPGALSDGHPTTKGDIVVGNDVWMGNEALVLLGVTIGDGAVIAKMQAVVTKDVEPYVIVAGTRAGSCRCASPRRCASSRSAIRWWDWPEATVLERRRGSQRRWDRGVRVSCDGAASG